MNLWGKVIPIWLLVAALTVTGVGAGIGLALGKTLFSEASPSIDQPIKLGNPRVIDEFRNPWPHQCTGSVNQIGAKFDVAVQRYAGENFVIELPIANRSDKDLFPCLSLAIPQKVVPNVIGNGAIKNAIKISNKYWRFRLPYAAKGINSKPFDGLKIKVNFEPNANPGFYKISGEIITEAEDETEQEEPEEAQPGRVHRFID